MPSWTKEQAITYYDALTQRTREIVKIDGKIMVVERDTRCSLNPYENSKMAVNLDSINIDRELAMLGLTNQEEEMTLHA